MALTTPRALEPAWADVLTRVVRRPVDERVLALMVERLSRRYNGEDVELARGDELLARVLFWFPRDVQKVALPVAELVRVGALPARPLRVLDVGAGAGATSLGVLRALATEAARGDSAVTVPSVASIVAVDTDSEVLGLMRRVAETAAAAGLLPAPLPALDTRVGDLGAPEGYAGSAPYDLILVGLALVEATRGAGGEPERGAAIAEHLARLIERAPLADDGAVIVIEPATRDETRALHHARARFLERGFGIFAPCTHAEACPMLERERDWCHEDLPADLPVWLRPVAQKAGLRWEGLTFSYLVVRRDARRSVRELLGTDAEATLPVRMVSQPRGTKGKTEAVASGAFEGPSRGARLMQLDREAKGARAGTPLLADLTRGDVVGLDRAAAGRAWLGKPVRLMPGEIVRPKR